MEHLNADVRQVAGFAAPGDDTALFLQELRQLRDGAGLGQAELAARAHFPYDSIRAAEAGPDLPDLPVLAAYVKGCGGSIEEWEERWRSLTRSPSLPVSDARLAGQSAAASAGARIGSAAADSDIPDPAVIIAALNRVAEGMASAGEAAPEAAASRPWAGSAADAAPAAAPAPAVGDDFGGPGGRAAGWDPIRVSSAWPALPASASEAGLPTDARPAPGGRPLPGPAEPARSRPGPGPAQRGPAAPWDAAPASTGQTPPAPWDAAPWAQSPAAGTSGAGLAGAMPRRAADPGAFDRGAFSSGAAGLGGPVAPVTGGMGAPATGGTGAPVAGGTVRGPGRPAAAAALPDPQWPGAAAHGARSRPGPPAGNSKARLLVVSAVLLCVLAVLLAIFA